MVKTPLLLLQQPLLPKVVVEVRVEMDQVPLEAAVEVLEEETTT
jgi:hypothetical protein